MSRSPLVGEEVFRTIDWCFCSSAHYYRCSIQTCIFGSNLYDHNNSLPSLTFILVRFILRKTTQTKGLSYTNKGIDTAREKVFCKQCGARDGYSKVAIVITDGRGSSAHEKLRASAQALKVRCFEIN